MIMAIMKWPAVGVYLWKQTVLLRFHLEHHPSTFCPRGFKVSPSSVHTSYTGDLAPSVAIV